MQLNEYEHILIKCQYINGVCDSLLKQIQKQTLSKQFLKSKLFNQEKNISNPDDQYQSLQYLKQKNRITLKQKQLNFNIQKSLQKINNLKNQISQLKNQRNYEIKYSKQNIKNIRQISQIQFQINQQRRLLNCQMQNLTCIETNNIQLRQAILDIQNKQSSIKHKINKLKQTQKYFIQTKNLQVKYNQLFAKRKNLIQKMNLSEQKLQSEILNKIQAISQSNQNLIEMQRYQRQLKSNIKQFLFIIDEIQSRQMKKSPKMQVNQTQNDDKLFEEQVTNLRKTIANRKFNKKYKTQVKLNQFHNNPTPKNVIRKSLNNLNNLSQKQTSHKSIFKIQYEPFVYNKVSNSVQILSNKSSPVNFVNQSLKNSEYKQSPQKQIKNKLIGKRFKRIQTDIQNKSSDFNNFEIQTLKKIIEKKQSQMNEALKLNLKQSENLNQNKSFNNQQKLQNSDLRDKSSYQQLEHSSNRRIKTELTPGRKYSSYTQQNKQINKFQQNQHQKIQYGANSRFIDQIIQNDTEQNLQRLKNKVRIRTKKSQTQKYNIVQKIKQNSKKQSNLKRNSQIIKPLNLNKQKISLDCQNMTPLSKQKYHKKSRELVKQQSSKRTAHSTQKNELQSSFSRIQTDQKSYRPVTLKYKEKVSTRSNFNKNIKQVAQQIQELKNHKKILKKQTIENEKSHSNNIAVFKLPKTKKYRNSVPYMRKGQPECVQQSDSCSNGSNIQLSKIEEQDQSIRKTKESIVNL